MNLLSRVGVPSRQLRGSANVAARGGRKVTPFRGSFFFSDTRYLGRTGPEISPPLVLSADSDRGNGARMIRTVHSGTPMSPICQYRQRFRPDPRLVAWGIRVSTRKVVDLEVAIGGACCSRDGPRNSRMT